MLRRVSTRHLKDSATQVLVVNWDCASNMTVLREIINTKRGKKQEATDTQQAFYADVSPNVMYTSKGTWSNQMKSKHGFIPFMAKIMAYEMMNVNEDEGWNFSKHLLATAGSQVTMVLIGGGLDVVAVATGRESDDSNLIKLFKNSDPIRQDDLCTLLAKTPYQAEGERMNLNVLWILTRYGIAHLKKKATWETTFLIICNDADAILQGAMPLIMALNNLFVRYEDDIGATAFHVLCQVKSKSKNALDKIGIQWNSQPNDAAGGGGNSGVANLSGRGMCTVVDLKSLFDAIESYELLPAYTADSGVPYAKGSGLRALAMTDGVFLYNGSDYISRLGSLGYRHWWKALTSRLHRSHVQQVMAKGGTVALFDVKAPMGLAARSRANLAEPDPLGSLAPSCTMNVNGFHLLYYAVSVSKPKTLIYLKKLFPNGNPVGTLKNQVRWDVVLICAALAGENVLPLSPGALLTRAAQMGIVAPQFTDWMFLDTPGFLEDPLQKSPFYRDAAGFLQVRWRPNPRLGNALENNMDTKSRAHFGDPICSLEPHSVPLNKIFPFPQYNITIKDCMTNNGREKTRTIALDMVHPKLAANSLAEVTALETGYTLGTGKFKATTNNTIGFDQVVKTTIVQATSYTRIGAATKVVKILNNCGARTCSEEMIASIVPDELSGTLVADKGIVVQKTLVKILEEVKDKEDGALLLLMNILKHVVAASLQERTEVEGDSESEEENDDDEENNENNQ